MSRLFFIKLILLISMAMFSHRSAFAQNSNDLILNSEQILRLNASGQSNLQSFLLQNTPRSFAVGPNGAIGWQTGGGDSAFVDQRAITRCETQAGPGNCRVVLRDLSIVKPGSEWTPAQAPAGAGISSMTHETVPDHRFIWWGPERARGVLVFAHGKSGQDDRGRQPQPWTRHFNNAGFDIWRFDRHPNSDETYRAASWYKADLAELRRRGYRTVIASGQSRGGWMSMMMLEEPNLVDGVIAIAAAAHYRWQDVTSESHMNQVRQMENVLVRAHGSSRARLAVVDFRNDPLVPQPDRRAALLREHGQRFAGFLLLDRPEGFEGHGVGNTSAFNNQFGACLLRFVTAPTAPSHC